jgi:hypothetical protein
MIGATMRKITYALLLATCLSYPVTVSAQSRPRLMKIAKRTIGHREEECVSCDAEPARPRKARFQNAQASLTLLQPQ